MHSVIETAELTKIYNRGSAPALDHLDLSVNAGEIFGYLGPNGAGKTTMIRLLLDLIRPTSGSARVLGMDSRIDSVAIRRRIGYLPGELNLWENQKAQTTLDYFVRLYGDVDRRVVNNLIERLNFDPSKRLRTYSTGNKRKLGLIIALMNEPELLILDEPTSGLDPLVQQTFYALMREAQAEGRTVFLSSHILAEVQAICDRVGILRNGRLQTVQSVDALTHVDQRVITLRLREHSSPDLFAHLPQARELKIDGKIVHLHWIGTLQPMLNALHDSHCYLEDMNITEPSLEDVFLSFYDGSSDEQHGDQFSSSTLLASTVATESAGVQ